MYETPHLPSKIYSGNESPGRSTNIRPTNSFTSRTNHRRTHSVGGGARGGPYVSVTSKSYRSIASCSATLGGGTVERRTALLFTLPRLG